MGNRLRVFLRVLDEDILVFPCCSLFFTPGSNTCPNLAGELTYVGRPKCSGASLEAPGSAGRGGSP